MAKNIGFVDFDDIEISKPNKEIMKEAGLKINNKNNRGGRKPKEVKADKLIRVYITADQQELLKEYCTKFVISESSLVKQLLIEKGVF